MKQQPKDLERRKWPRLPLTVPVFLRSQDGNGQELLEFATALNVSAGGALVALRRPLPLSAQVSLEVPTGMVETTDGLPKTARVIRARVTWIKPITGYQLVGFKFARPLLDQASREKPTRRKPLSPV